MFTATLLALGTRLVKFHFSSLVKISVFASFALKIEQLSIKWAQECLKLKIWVLIRLKHAWKPKLEIWNFTSLVPRARSVAVNIFSKCHGKDEWTLERRIIVQWWQTRKKVPAPFFSAQLFPCYYKRNQPNIICLFINFYEPSDLSTRNSKKPHVILLCRNCYKSEIWNDDELILLLFYLTPLTAQAGSLITPPTSSAETPTRSVTPLPYLS